MADPATYLQPFVVTFKGTYPKLLERQARSESRNRVEGQFHGASFIGVCTFQYISYFKPCLGN